MPPDCGHGNPSLTPEERWAYGFAHLPFGFQGSADRDTPEVGLKPGCDAMESVSETIWTSGRL